jgi:hypoxanthine phosphoribosyltransferase
MGNLKLVSGGRLSERGNASYRVVLTAEQIHRRVQELARQISLDFRGKTIHAVCVLENGFIFMADLIRELRGEMVCHFIRPDFNEVGGTTNIFYSPELEVTGSDVLLVETVLETGVTSEFLMRNVLARGAATVRLVTLLDRQAARRILLQPDYFGFLVDEPYVFGYGLGAPHQGRNLPFLATAGESA